MSELNEQQRDAVDYVATHGTLAAGLRIAELQATITELTALLEAAACPNCGIEKSAMAYRHGSGWERCQWCYEVLAALKEKTDE